MTRGLLERVRSGRGGDRGARGETHGLRMILAALVVIGLITALLAQHDTRSRREQVRARGVGLARVLSRIPPERLLQNDGSQGPLQLIRSSQGHPDFAYAAIVDPRGRPLADVAAPGVLVPPSRVSEEPSSWTGERLLREEGRRPIREFFAPVLAQGELVAQVRIGFFEPSLVGILDHTPLVGALALLVFGLTSLSYFLMKREILPVVAATSRLHELVDRGRLDPVRLEATGPLAEFLSSFNAFVELADRRIQELRSEQTGLLASSKVLSYQKSRFELLLQNLPEAAVALDPSGNVTFATARLEVLLGVAADDAMARRPSDWCPSPEVVRFLAPYCDGPAARRRSDAMEFSAEGASPRRIAVSAHPLLPRHEADEAGGTLVVFRDVTAETLARQTQAEFLGHMAHELKTPLHVLTMYSESLSGEEGQQEEFRVEACNVIQDEVERLTSLVETLLSIARIASGNVTLDRQRVRLRDFLSDVQQSTERIAERAGVTLSVELPRELPTIHVDKALLRIALNNLLTNAIKYNREPGSVTLRAETSDHAIAIRVSDSGIGIHESDLERIFEKFYRGENAVSQKQRGHGLGLALVREIVELHGGEIEVQSQPGEGSQFSLVFPKTAALIPEVA